MLQIAYRMTGNYDDACEVVQDAFLAAFRSIRDFRGDARFSTWLSSITINLSKNRIKQSHLRSRREPVSLDDPLSTEDGALRFEPASHDPSPVAELERRELDRQIQDCLNGLDQEFREAIVLRDVQGYSYDEISRMLNIAAGTVKSRIFRARESVRNCLQQRMVEL